MQRNWFGMPNMKWMMQASPKEIILDGLKVGAIAGIPVGIIALLVAAVAK